MQEDQILYEALGPAVAESLSASLEKEEAVVGPEAFSWRKLFPGFISDVYRVVDAIVAGSELRGLEIIYLTISFDLSGPMPEAWALIASDKGIVILMAKPEITVNEVDYVISKAEEIGDTTYSEVEVVPAVAGYSIEYDAERYARSIDIPIFHLGFT